MSSEKQAGSGSVNREKESRPAGNQMLAVRRDKCRLHITRLTAFRFN